MGKSTINGHFQKQNVSLPEGFSGGLKQIKDNSWMVNYGLVHGKSYPNG